MKKLFIIGILFSLTACGGNKYQQTWEPVPQVNAYLDTEKVVTPMSRNAVIAAISDCEGNNMRAVMSYSKTRINNYLADVVIDVNCAPRYRGLF
jgi:hypothetical protein